MDDTYDLVLHNLQQYNCRVDDLKDFCDETVDKRIADWEAVGVMQLEDELIVRLKTVKGIVVGEKRGLEVRGVGERG